jgi:hypothetical protein
MESEGFAIYDAMMRMKTEVVFFLPYYLSSSILLVERDCRGIG